MNTLSFKEYNVLIIYTYVYNIITNIKKIKQLTVSYINSFKIKTNRSCANNFCVK